MDISPEQRLQDRADALVRSSLATRERLAACKRSIARMGQDTHHELEALQEALAAASASRTALAADITNVLGRLRGTAKQGDLARVQSRIDAWAVERKLSRPALRAMLDDEFSP
jgi:hypothetical protein